MEMIVLQAQTPQNETKTVLVREDSYEGKTADYFPSGSGYHSFKKLGKIEIDGDDNVIRALHDIYNSN